MMLLRVPVVTERWRIDWQRTNREPIGECVIQCPMPLPLHILQLLFVQPEIVAQFMDDSQADLFADFGLA
jgi:hypothetical protein